MTENPYQVLGPTIPLKLGRESLINRINHHLLKPTPDHVSVVGPEHYGKSVLLWHLADYYRKDCEALKYYLTTVYIDLRRNTPTDDSTFKSRLAGEIKNALALVKPEYSEYVNLEDEKILELLEEIFDELWKSYEARMLVVLDSFDYVLAGTGLTRNLWDQLRDLAQRNSLRFVTGSRRPLRELCKTEESRTSDFWEIFYDTPIQVTALDKSDWNPFLEPFLEAGCKLDNSACKEVTNWTGGVPLLVCALLGELWKSPRTQQISKDHVDEAAKKVLGQRSEPPRGSVGRLWCRAACRSRCACRWRDTANRSFRRAASRN